LEKVKGVNPMEFQQEFQFLQLVQGGNSWVQEFENFDGK